MIYGCSRQNPDDWFYGETRKCHWLDYFTYSEIDVLPAWRLQSSPA
jgi:hypothetical protein